MKKMFCSLALLLACGFAYAHSGSVLEYLLSPVTKAFREQFHKGSLRPILG